jgi:hypothetical protein
LSNLVEDLLSRHGIFLLSREWFALRAMPIPGSHQADNWRARSTCIKLLAATSSIGDVA